MKIKLAVQDQGVCREIWYALGVADAIKTSAFGKELVVTSLTDGVHNPGSLHPKGRAVDLRILDLTNAQAHEFLVHLQTALDRFGFDIIFEGGIGATPATTGAHIHIEYDPRAGEIFMPRTDQDGHATTKSQAGTVHPS